MIFIFRIFQPISTFMLEDEQPLVDIFKMVLLIWLLFWLQNLAVFFRFFYYQFKYVVIMSQLFLNCGKVLAAVKQIFNSSSLSDQSCLKSSFFSREAKLVDTPGLTRYFLPSQDLKKFNVKGWKPKSERIRKMCKGAAIKTCSNAVWFWFYWKNGAASMKAW